MRLASLSNRIGLNCENSRNPFWITAMEELRTILVKLSPTTTGMMTLAGWDRWFPCAPICFGAIFAACISGGLCAHKMRRSLKRRWSHRCLPRRKSHDIHIIHASPTTTEAMARIGALYGIEEHVRGKPAEVRREVRQSRARPQRLSGQRRTQNCSEQKQEFGMRHNQSSSAKHMWARGGPCLARSGARADYLMVA